MTMDEMIIHSRAVRRGAKHICLGDIFVYQSSVEKAVENRKARKKRKWMLLKGGGESRTANKGYC